MSLPSELVPAIFPCERDGSGSLDLSPNGISGKRQWAVPWDLPDGTRYYVQFMQQLLGMTIVGPTGTPNFTYPDVFSADFPWLYCQSLSVHGEEQLGTDAWGRMRYRRAIIDASYSPYDIGESIDLSGQALPIAKGSFSYIGRLFKDPPMYTLDPRGTYSPQQLYAASQDFQQAYQAWRTETDRYFLRPGLPHSEFAGRNTRMRVYMVPRATRQVVRNLRFTSTGQPWTLSGFTLRLSYTDPDGTISPIFQWSFVGSDVDAFIEAFQYLNVGGGSVFVLTGGPLPTSNIRVEAIAGPLVDIEPANLVCTISNTDGSPDSLTCDQELHTIPVFANPITSIQWSLTLPGTSATPGETFSGEFDGTADSLYESLNAIEGGDAGVTWGFEVTGGPLPEEDIFIEFTGTELAGRPFPPMRFTNSVPGASVDDPVYCEVLEAGNTASATDGDTVDQALTKVIPTGEYSLERHQVLSPNFWNFISIIGTVNCSYFLGFPPWSLLFSGMSGRKTVLPNGTRCWNLSFKFHFNPNGWNMVFRPDTGQWEVVCANGQARQRYYAIANGAYAQPDDLARETTEALHPWLYRPADFNAILLFG